MALAFTEVEKRWTVLAEPTPLPGHSFDLAAGNELEIIGPANACTVKRHFTGVGSPEDWGFNCTYDGVTGRLSGKYKLASHDLSITFFEGSPRTHAGSVAASVSPVDTSPGGGTWTAQDG